MTALPRDAAQLGGEGARDHGTALDRGATMRVEKERPRDATTSGTVIDHCADRRARPMKRRYHQPAVPGKPATLICLDCARARREGRPWGCAAHVAEDVL